jgi:hypothetical protein
MSGKTSSADSLAKEDTGSGGVEAAMAATRGRALLPNAARATDHPKEEVEAECHEYVRRANINDWASSEGAKRCGSGWPH